MDVEEESETLKLISMNDQRIESMSEDRFRQLHNFHTPPQPNKWTRLKKTAVTICRITPYQLFPIISWIKEYNLSHFLGDLTAGLTVAILQVPHALAFAPLGGQPAVVGLYMAVFPPLMYVIFGTSRHLSLGIFAILIMMVGKVVEDNVGVYSAMEVCIAISFLVGALQLLFGFLRLGFVFVLLSDNLVSGFTCGAAVHILVLQFKYLLGVNPTRTSGPLKLIYNFIEIMKSVPSANFVAFGIALSVIALLSSFNELAKPKIAKRTKIPVPADFVIISLATIVSYALDLNGKYNVQVVGEIPAGLPDPVLPPFSLMPKILMSCLVIAFVNISVNISLAALFAKKGGYVLDNNQEMRAIGISNIFGSFLQSLPVCGSISRTSTQYAVGGKTQMASAISSLLGLSLLMFAGKVLELIPMCALAGVVFVTLKPVLMQIKEVPKIWRRGRYDAFVWVATFFTVVVVDVDYGLATGLALSVLSLILGGTRTEIIVLGKIPEQEIFVDSTYYDTQSSVLILKIVGGINFANNDSVMKNIAKEYEKFCVSDEQGLKHFMIVDFAAVTYLDCSGVDGLSNLSKELDEKNCQLLLTNCSYIVYQCLERCKFFTEFPKDYVIFSIADALSFLRKIKAL